MLCIVVGGVLGRRGSRGLGLPQEEVLLVLCSHFASRAEDAISMPLQSKQPDEGFTADAMYDPDSRITSLS